MPQSDYGAAVGYYGFDAFILGGVNKPKQMTRYESWNGRNGKYINRGTSKLKRQTFGTSQYYVQLNHTLYIIDPLDSRINLYDLENDVLWNKCMYILYRILHQNDMKPLHQNVHALIPSQGIYDQLVRDQSP